MSSTVKTPKPPKREEHYRVDGREVSIEELAREINRAGGFAVKGQGR